MQLTIRQRFNLKLLILITPFLMGINVDMYTPSLPAIRDYFHAPTHLVQLTISSYVLAYGIGQIFLGVLSDCIGRKKIVISSLGIYTLASLASAAAPNIHYLLILRFIQGLCLAGTVVTMRAVVRDIFKGIELAKTVNNVSMCWSIGPIIGPFIGGFLQHYFNWRADFLFFAAYGLFAFICAVITLPETLDHSLKIHPKHIAHTLKTILIHRNFMLASTIGMLLTAILILFNVISPFFLQTVLHFSPIMYGNIALFMGLGYFVGASINRILISRLRSNIIVYTSMITSIILSGIMLFFGIFSQPNVYFFVVPAVLLFITTGINFPNVAIIFSSIFDKSAGTASAISGSISASGVAIISVLATTSKTTTAVPLATLYISISIGCLLLYSLIRQSKS